MNPNYSVALADYLAGRVSDPFLDTERPRLKFQKFRGTYFLPDFMNGGGRFVSQRLKDVLIGAGVDVFWCPCEVIEPDTAQAYWLMETKIWLNGVIDEAKSELHIQHPSRFNQSTEHRFIGGESCFYFNEAKLPKRALFAVNQYGVPGPWVTENVASEVQRSGCTGIIWRHPHWAKHANPVVRSNKGAVERLFYNDSLSKVVSRELIY